MAGGKPDHRLLVLLVFGLIMLAGHLAGPLDFRILSHVEDPVHIWLDGPGVNKGLYRVPASSLPPAASIAELYRILGLNQPVPGFSDVRISDLTGLYVRDRQDPVSIAVPPQLTDFFFRPVPINRADKETLVLLPGIGPRLADRIIDFRERHDRVASLQDLLLVSGIGPDKVARLRDRISFE